MSARATSCRREINEKGIRRKKGRRRGRGRKRRERKESEEE
jgi:hypothetical protein